MFRGEFNNVADHDDAYAMFLFGHYVVERWREILLWSWLVARIGGDNDEWRPTEEQALAWSELGGVPHTGLLTAQTGPRDTLVEDTINFVLGRKHSSPTTYAFCE